MRERRKQELEEAIEAARRQMDITEDAAEGFGMEDNDSDNEAANGSGDESKPAAITAADLDKEELYVDEDKYTTVTVEAMDPSDDDQSSDDSDDEEQLDADGNVIKKEDKYKTVDGKDGKPKKKKEKKKKFRYLSKPERKMERVKLKVRKTKERAKFSGERDEVRKTGKGGRVKHGTGKPKAKR